MNSNYITKTFSAAQQSVSRQVGVCAISGSFPHLGRIPLSSVVHARPPDSLPALRRGVHPLLRPRSAPPALMIDPGPIRLTLIFP